LEREHDLIRLILGPDGAVAVDPKGGGFGRGAHLHARPSCVDRAARAGLLRATKGKAFLMPEAKAGEAGHEGGQSESDRQSARLRTDSLARAIQASMDRRIEGLVAAAVRSRQVAWDAEAVTSACRRGEAELVVVACDAALCDVAGADLTEVRRAVAEGRAVAWGSKQRLGALVRLGASAVKRRAERLEPGAIANVPVRGKLDPPPGDDGVGVVAIGSRTIAAAVKRAVEVASAVLGAGKEGSHGPRTSSRQAGAARRAKVERNAE
jgi:hypothetical protein